MMSPSRFDADLNEERASLKAALTQLKTIVGGDVGADLVGTAKAFGVDHALDDIEKDYRGYGLTTALSTAVLEKLRDPLETACQAEEKLQAIVDEREAELTAASPYHNRVFIHLGREFTYDHASSQIKYLDEAKPRSLPIERVRTDPDVDLKHEQMLERERQADRGRGR